MLAGTIIVALFVGSLIEQRGKGVLIILTKASKRKTTVLKSYKITKMFKSKH